MKEKHRENGENGVGQLTTVGKKRKTKKTQKELLRACRACQEKLFCSNAIKNQEAQTRERTLMEGERRHALVDATRTDNMKKQNREETNVK